jgi:signal peptidase I
MIKKFWKEITLGAVILFFIVTGLLWLAAILLGFIFGYTLAMWGCRKIKNRFVKRVAVNVILLVFVLLAGIASELFLIEIYRVPTPSMENALLTDDVILVNKLDYGPRLPNDLTEISWINLFMHDHRETGDSTVESYKRAKGLAGIKRGDVLVYDQDKTNAVVKRCIAVAGDLFELIDGEVYIDKTRCEPPRSVRNYYTLTLPDRKSFVRYLDKFDTEKKVVDYMADSNKLTLDLEGDEVNDLETDKGVRIGKRLDSLNLQTQLFATPLDSSWTLDKMGPFRIPWKGMELTLTPGSIAIYGGTIKKYEQAVVERKGNDYYVDGRKTAYYRFRQDYFFMMGDNRKISMDSRYIGFVPENSVIGKVALVLFSFNNDKFRPERMLRTIH